MTLSPEPIGVANLRAEAAYLHLALYDSAAPQQVIDQYVASHEFYCRAPVRAVNLNAIISRQLDVEALEIVLRRHRPALTQKLRLLFYLSEARPEYYSQLVNDQNRPLGAWLSLVRGVVWTAYKRAKGTILLARNPDV